MSSSNSSLLKTIQNWFVSFFYINFVEPARVLKKHSRTSLLSLLVVFFLLLNYNLLRVMKTVFILTVPNAQNSIIPFLKIIGVLPMALALALILSRLSRSFSLYQIFFIFSAFYMLFFAFFGYEFSEISEYFIEWPIKFFEQILPRNINDIISPLLAVIRFWPVSLFYCLAEMWSLTILFYAFWGSVNLSISNELARPLYPLLMFAGNISGFFLPHISGLGRLFTTSEKLPQFLCLVLVGNTLIATICFTFLAKSFDTTNKENNIEKKDVPQNISFVSSIKSVSKSKMLLLLSITLICYHLIVNITEVMWHQYTLIAFSELGSMHLFLSDITSYIAVGSTLLAVLLPSLLNRLGVLGTGILFPAASFAFCTLFCSCAIWFAVSGGSSQSEFFLIGMTPAMFASWSGGLLNVILRSGKYSIFDTIKELCFLVLPSEKQIEGKVVLETVGSRLGKTLGSVSYIFISSVAILIGSSTSTPIIGSCIAIVLNILWAVATIMLCREYEAQSAKQK